MTDLTCHAANVFTQTCNLQQEDWLTLILPLVPEGWLVALGCIRTDQCLKETSRDLRNVPEPIGPGILGAFSSPSFFLLHSLPLSQIPSNIFTPYHLLFPSVTHTQMQNIIVLFHSHIHAHIQLSLPWSQILLLF